jgi:hypothetical protein
VIRNEPDAQTREELQKEFVDQDYTPGPKLMTLRSLCHERQAEGLILFAKRMEWPGSMRPATLLVMWTPDNLLGV